jgi:hypothetical protein
MDSPKCALSPIRDPATNAASEAMANSLVLTPAMTPVMMPWRFSLRSRPAQNLHRGQLSTSVFALHVPLIAARSSVPQTARALARTRDASQGRFNRRFLNRLLPNDRRISCKRLARPTLSYVPLSRHRSAASLGEQPGRACRLHARVRQHARQHHAVAPWRSIARSAKTNCHQAAGTRYTRRCTRPLWAPTGNGRRGSELARQ